MRLITKKLRLQFNKDGSKLIDTKSINGEKWFDTESNTLFFDTKKIRTGIEKITSKSIILNFKKMLESVLDEITYVIDINTKWLNIGKVWKIPIEDGHIIKEPLLESEIPAVKELINKQFAIKKQYQDCYDNIKI